jgi:hypothetical protein
LYIVASLVGFLVALVTWFAGSYLVAHFIYWGSRRQPTPLSDKSLKAYEIILCGIMFVISVAVLFFVARALWPEHS